MNKLSSFLSAVLAASLTWCSNLQASSSFQVEYAAYAAQENEHAVLVAVLRSGDIGEVASVDYATVESTAIAGEDYGETIGTLAFAPNETLQTVSIPLLNDGLKEPDERFRLMLSNPSEGAELGTLRIAFITVRDNDPGVRFEHDLYWVRESDGSVDLRVLRGNDVEIGPFTVDFATADLTAKDGEDYTAWAGTLEFAEGEMSQTITLSVLADEVSEVGENLKINLAHVTGSAALGTEPRAEIVLTDTTGMTPPGFRGIERSPDGTVLCHMSAGVSQPFEPFLRIFRTDTSTDLVEWERFGVFAAENDDLADVMFADQAGADIEQRYYRVRPSNGIAPMLPPTGPYAVGRTKRMLTDPDRIRWYGGDGTHGSFMAWIWYPAEVSASAVPASFEPEAFLRLPDYWGDWLDRVAYMVTYAYPEAPLATSEGNCPVVVYSHGWGCTAYDNMDKAEELASHGFIVVAIDHEDAGVSVFPDGSVIWGPGNWHGQIMIERENDLEWVLDELVHWQQEDPVLQGRLDLDRVGIMGYSLGGGAAAETCRADDRVDCAMLLDAALYFEAFPVLAQQGLQEPFLAINGAASTVRTENLTLYSKADQDAVAIAISAADHLDFNIWHWGYFPATIPEGREVNGTVRAYTLAFFNAYLRDQVEPLLENPSAEYPRVSDFSRK